jgi:peptide/nickel transport system substrate-binding protein
VRGRALKVALPVLALALAASVAAAMAAVHRSTASNTLVFGTAADPAYLDGALVSDGESIRAINQIVETLVALKPGTTTVAPLLATSWKSRRGRVWTFQLRKGVKFSDGTPFNAAAVCFNFNRWYHFSGPFQDPDATYYWQTVLGGFAHNESSDLPPSTYRSCKAAGKYTAVITLTKPFGPLLPALTLSAFSIASPTALKQYGADQAVIKNGTFTPTGTYAFQHPTGTGPYMLKEWDVGQKLVLVANPNYWGPKPKVSTIILRPISDSTARLQALQTGEIQGMDFVAPQDIKTLQSAGKFKILLRPPFNVGYVTINSAIAPTNNLLVREAIAYGLDKQGVVNAFYGGLGKVAKEFEPPSGVIGYTPTVQDYTYSPDKAKALLKQAGMTLPVKLDFWYPTNVVRPYMPNPKGIFEAFTASLENSGFQIVPHSAPWRPDYVKLVDSGQAGNINLIGWIGDYADPDDWLGVFFKSHTDQFGFNDPYLFSLLQKAASVGDIAQRTKLYQTANQYIMSKLVPGVPYANSYSALAFDQNVAGYIPSPTQVEFFKYVYYK